MSSRRSSVLFIGRIALSLAAVLAALPASAQYPGQITKKDKDAPELRAVGVLEWTGEAGKPKASRLVPITVFDGTALQDGGIYLARPQPMAVDGGVEYVLQEDGKRIGLYDIDNSGQKQGSWVGLGSWKPMPSAKPPRPAAQMAHDDMDDAGSDRPVLHRKHGSPGGGSKGGDNGDSGSSGPAPAADPDRPTLHKKTTSDDSGDAGSNPAPDPDRPTLHKASTTDDSAGAPAADPDRPTLKKSKQKPTADTGYVESVGKETDPDRPRLLRGKSTGDGPAVTPTLMGLPEDMQQAVAVSDAANRPEHPWSYSWANPGDEEKMKAAAGRHGAQRAGAEPATGSGPQADGNKKESQARCAPAACTVAR